MSGPERKPAFGLDVFGLDVFGLDDRLRLFGYVTADNRLAYLWVLRAFDAARANYHVLLHTSEVAAALAALRAAQPDCPEPAELELPRLLGGGVYGRWSCRGSSVRFSGLSAARMSSHRRRVRGSPWVTAPGVSLVTPG